MNLCEILKGHEGETFYSPAFGDVKLEDVNCPSVCTNPIKTRETTGMAVYFSKEGKFNITNNSECELFPSKDQRDWNKWIKEQKLKAPKIWSDLGHKINFYNLQRISWREYRKYPITEEEITPIEKSVFAFLKIHIIIKAGYGGIPTKEERNDPNNSIYILDYINDKWKPIEAYYNIDPIAFHTKEQCLEFLSYPENVQLLEDFYMV